MSHEIPDVVAALLAKEQKILLAFCARFLSSIVDSSEIDLTADDPKIAAQYAELHATYATEALVAFITAENKMDVELLTSTLKTDTIRDVQMLFALAMNYLTGHFNNVRLSDFKVSQLLMRITDPECTAALLPTAKARRIFLGAASYHLSQCYQEGIGVSKNKERSNFYLEQASRLGSIAARINYPQLTCSLFEVGLNAAEKKLLERAILLENSATAWLLVANVHYALASQETNEQAEFSQYFSKLEGCADAGSWSAHVQLHVMYKLAEESYRAQLEAYDPEILQSIKIKAEEFYHIATQRVGKALVEEQIAKRRESFLNKTDEKKSKKQQRLLFCLVRDMTGRNERLIPAEVKSAEQIAEENRRAEAAANALLAEEDAEKLRVAELLAEEAAKAIADSCQASRRVDERSVDSGRVSTEIREDALSHSSSISPHTPIVDENREEQVLTPAVVVVPTSLPPTPIQLAVKKLKDSYQNEMLELEVKKYFRKCAQKIEKYIQAQDKGEDAVFEYSFASGFFESKTDHEFKKRWATMLHTLYLELKKNDRYGSFSNAYEKHSLSLRCVETQEKYAEDLGVLKLNTAAARCYYTAHKCVEDLELLQSTAHPSRSTEVKAAVQHIKNALRYINISIPLDESNSGNHHAVGVPPETNAQKTVFTRIITAIFKAWNTVLNQFALSLPDDLFLKSQLCTGYLHYNKSAEVRMVFAALLEAGFAAVSMQGTSVLYEAYKNKSAYPDYDFCIYLSSGINPESIEILYERLREQYEIYYTAPRNAYYPHSLVLAPKIEGFRKIDITIYTYCKNYKLEQIHKIQNDYVPFCTVFQESGGQLTIDHRHMHTFLQRKLSIDVNVTKIKSDNAEAYFFKTVFRFCGSIIDGTVVLTEVAKKELYLLLCINKMYEKYCVEKGYTDPRMQAAVFSEFAGKAHQKEAGSFRFFKAEIAPIVDTDVKHAVKVLALAYSKYGAMHHFTDMPDLFSEDCSFSLTQHR